MVHNGILWPRLQPRQFLAAARFHFPSRPHGIRHLTNIFVRGGVPPLPNTVRAGGCPLLSSSPLLVRRVCVVGSGPSGMYAVKNLLQQNSVDIKVDVYEKSAEPFGLVRFGVAPDHPEVKNVVNEFRKLLEDPRVTYFGNVKVDKDQPVNVDHLRESYDAVILAAGGDGERNLAIPGADLRGVVTAGALVKWYNGHADAPELAELFSRIAERYGEAKPRRAIIIGHGNVALDVARMLTKPAVELEKTSISRDALDAFRKLALDEVEIVGRRGWVQSAFSTAALREVLSSPSMRTVMASADFEDSLNPASLEELQQNRMKSRLQPLFKLAVENFENLEATNSCDQKKSVARIRCLASPIRFLPSPLDPSAVGFVQFQKNSLEGPPGRQKVADRPKSEALNAGAFESFTVSGSLVILSLGFTVNSFLGMDGISLNASGGVKHSRGRVVFHESEESRLRAPHRAPVYVTGWLKRGCVGTIASNILDAKETVNSALKDFEAARAS